MSLRSCLERLFYNLHVSDHSVIGFDGEFFCFNFSFEFRGSADFYLILCRVFCSSKKGSFCSSHVPAFLNICRRFLEFNRDLTS